MKDLLFNFEGRIARASYWGGSIVLGLTSVGLAVLIAILFRNALDADTIYRINAALALCLLYPVAALVTKRVKDRDRPLSLVKLFLLPYGLLLIGDGLSITSQAVLVEGEVVRTYNTIGKFLAAANFCVMFWALIELGILRGTNGSNKWGPDPLQSKGPSNG